MNITGFTGYASAASILLTWTTPRIKRVADAKINTVLILFSFLAPEYGIAHFSFQKGLGFIFGGWIPLFDRALTKPHHMLKSHP
jgi:hypothetical protein